jgi:mono/diheme cytochrome c family protein
MRLWASIAGHIPALLCFGFVWHQGIAHSQTAAPKPASKTLKLSTGKEIYQAACIGCHGPDGKGQPKTTSGFEPPATFPDFTDCRGTTPEPNDTWRTIIHLGGRGRGFSDIMPSFTEALSGDQIEKVILYLREFCKEPSWPRGELNFPRAIVTEKAYPEDEVVLTTSLDTNGSSQTNTVVYEKRFGVRNQFEAQVPIVVQRQDAGGRFGGIGDVTLGMKRVIASSLRTGSIFSLSGEVTLPTGNRTHDIGTGTTIFEGFAAFGQMLPRNSFVQTQVGTEQPTDTAKAPRAVFWRTAVGSSVAKKNFGRLFTPMVEVIADRDLVRGAKTNWDVMPEMQVTLNKRQHIRAAFGVRFPVTNTGGRTTQVGFYLLWDTFDGGLFDGWR